MTDKCDSPDVEFCGYSIPHPSEAKMNLRIQTYGKHHLPWTDPDCMLTVADGVSVYSVLEKGLEDLMAMCDVVEEKFKISRDDFVNQMQE